MSKKRNLNYFYPNTDDEHFQEKIMKKREFYYHKINQRDILKSEEEINDYRDFYCGKQDEFQKREWQIFLSNFISPETPYTGLLIMHGTGTGKTCTAISVAEQFKEQVKKYNTKIFVLVPGTNIKENWKEQLLFCTGETYFKNKDLLDQMTKEEREIEKRGALYGALQYYRILSYKTFHRKVLGEKITERQLDDGKIKKSYKKTDDGEVEREIVVDKITNMDNSILIVDEAHNLTKNDYGEALKKIIKNSQNLKVILLSATPMKNLADDIIDMLNFIRPVNDPIQRDKVFTSDKNHLMKFKPNGKEYLEKMAKGYVSYFRGNMPYTFAKRVEKGSIPDGLLFTPVTQCFMDKFQLKYYYKTLEEEKDGLEKSSSSAANFVYPGLDKDNKLIGYYSANGLAKVLNQLDDNKLIKTINKELFNNKIDKNDLTNFMMESPNKNITGNILKEKYLKTFSVKFYECLRNINQLVNDKASTAFVYSNLVNAGGIDTFAEVLKMNGYLEYKENDSEYNIENNTIDSKTGKTFEEFKKSKLDTKDFHPATYMIITGGNEDDEIPEIKQKIIKSVFNNVNNINGKYLKLILGSRVMSEGVTLENTKEIHILDVHYNLGRVEQVIGRGIRFCKHQKYIKKTGDILPEVNVYKYVVSIKNDKLSSDEVLYQKAEKKYILVKKVERVLKETAVDCPILLHGNVFPEDVKEYKDCVEPTLENVKKGKKICPALCDFEKCDFKCNDTGLKYDEKHRKYHEINDIDYGTFNDNMSKSEVDIVKNRIKNLYKFKHVYVYKELLDKITKSLTDKQKDMFDNYFLDKSLHDLMPRTENDYNNFKDTVYDKFNRSGYLIQRGKYYIFQPFNDNENIPLSTRKSYKLDIDNNINVKNFTTSKYGEDFKNDIEIKETRVIKDDYTYDMKYYDKRDENFIVGIIDKNKSGDVFKVRPPLKKSEKARATGVVSFKGAVCNNAKDKAYLLTTVKKLSKILPEEIKLSGKFSRVSVCDKIMDSLIYLEKYTTSKDRNKITYMIVPENHPEYEYPLNLEDRVKHIINTITDIVKRKFDYVVKKEDKGMKYIIEIKSDKYIDNIKSDLTKMKFNKSGSKYIRTLE